MSSFFVALIVGTGIIFAQTEKRGSLQTVKLPSSEKVFDASREWDIFIENSNEFENYGHGALSG